MMKKITITLMMFALIALLVACGTKEEKAADTSKKDTTLLQVKQKKAKQLQSSMNLVKRL